MAKEYVKGMYAKKPSAEWVASRLNIKYDVFFEWLKDKKQWAEENNGYITIDVKRSLSNTDEFYTEMSTWKPKPIVTASQYSPDREDAEQKAQKFVSNLEKKMSNTSDNDDDFLF